MSRDLALPLGKTWLLALGLLAASLGGLELFWRQRGEFPCPTADAALWASQRERLEGADRTRIALLGSSRIQIGFSMDEFRELRPDLEPVMLAVAGDGPFSALLDLAQDESFAGTVICSVTGRTLENSRRLSQKPFVDYYHNVWGPGAKVSRQLSLPLQETFVVLAPHLALENIVKTLDRTGELPSQYVYTRRDRQRIADYRRFDIAAAMPERLARLRFELRSRRRDTPQEWLVVCRTLGSLARRIESRGGRVAFVSMPVRGPLKTILDRAYPRARYWDVLAAEVGVPAIYCDDLPGVAEMHCPDGSHLANKDIPAFTRILTKELERLEVLPPTAQ